MEYLCAGKMVNQFGNYAICKIGQLLVMCLWFKKAKGWRIILQATKDLLYRVLVRIATDIILMLQPGIV